MGQPNAKRLQFSPIQTLTSALNDDRQTLNQTYFVKVGDTLEFWDQNSAGCLETLVGSRIVTGVDPDVAITLDSAIDLTGVVGQAVIRNRSIDDVQVAIERLYAHGFEAEDYLIQWSAPITASLVDFPIVGQSAHTVADATCWATGDAYAVMSDDGLNLTGTVIGILPATNQVIIDQSADATLLTNPKLLNTSVDLKETLRRLKSLIDQIGTPVCEALLDGNCSDSVFYASQTFVQNSSQFYLDGVRKRKGTTGTRASLVNGAGDGELTFTSLVLGLDGNDIDVEMLDPGAASQALSVTVTGTYEGQDRKVSISLATDAGSALISTALDIAVAVNASGSARRLVSVIYGGTGLDVQAALVATSLSGGLNNGTGDYVELQVLQANTLGGYGILSFHIRPEEANRMSSPPQESEELDLCYALAV